MAAQAQVRSPAATMPFVKAVPWITLFLAVADAAEAQRFYCVESICKCGDQVLDVLRMGYVSPPFLHLIRPRGQECRDSSCPRNTGSTFLQFASRDLDEFISSFVQRYEMVRVRC